MCAGGAAASVVLSFLYFRLPSPRQVIAINGGVCALLAALTVYPHSLPVLTPLVAGFLSTAAPLTSVFRRRPAIETMSEAIQFAGRVGGLLALNLVYGAAFAMVGFLGVLFITTSAAP
ncbi:MAG: hypothetical protein WBZ37_14860 [Mycobacterium sp.]